MPGTIDRLTYIQLQRLYRYLAPIYRSIRPLWTKTLTARAENCFEKEILPNIIQNGDQLLDIGCGPAPNLERMRRLGFSLKRYVGIDLSADMLSHQFHQNLIPARVMQADAYRLPFSANSFDTVISTWMFSHILTPVRVIHEILRVLKPGGQAAILCFSMTDGWKGRLEHLAEAVFLMRCLSQKEVLSWPCLVSSQTFDGGINTLAHLRKPYFQPIIRPAHPFICLL